MLLFIDSGVVGEEPSSAREHSGADLISTYFACKDGVFHFQSS
jgi:hypothetical protein